MEMKAFGVGESALVNNFPGQHRQQMLSIFVRCFENVQKEIYICLSQKLKYLDTPGKTLHVPLLCIIICPVFYNSIYLWNS